MNITQVSELTKTSSHTLRYYEKIGLIININRNASGHRDYTDNDIVWIEFIKRLKETNMPLSEIKRFAVLRSKGDKTINDRVRMLIEHRERVEKQINKLQYHRTKIDEKIVLCKKGGRLSK